MLLMLLVALGTATALGSDAQPSSGATQGGGGFAATRSAGSATCLRELEEVLATKDWGEPYLTVPEALAWHVSEADAQQYT